MTIRNIPLRPVPADEMPIFIKHISPPTFGGGPIDPVTPTRVFKRNLLVNVDLEVDGGTKVPMWVLEDPDDPVGGKVFPSKLIRTVEGDICHAIVGARTNTHTVHWHGIEPTSMNDGVGKHSFEVSGNFTYQFATRQAGTFLYHCHKNTALHFEMGLYGGFVVDPKKPNTPEAAGVPEPPYPTGGPGFILGWNPPTHLIKYDVEAIWVPDDIDTRWHKLGHDAFMEKVNLNDPLAAENFTHDGILNDLQPDVFTLSGEAKRAGDDSLYEKQAIHCKVGQTVLIRVIDASYTVNEMRFGLPVEMVAEDGHPFGVGDLHRYSKPIKFAAMAPIRLTAAMRFDLLVRPTQKGRFPVEFDHMHWVSLDLMHTTHTFIDVT